LRCFHQRQRFGEDGLYTVQRYINGFTRSQVTDGFGNVVDNPLFRDSTCPAGSTTCSPLRDPRLVIFTTISGVPWQDVTRLDGAGIPDPSVGVMSSSELVAAGRWDIILGNPDSDVNPTDPFMIESRVPRMTGAQNPVTGASIAPPNSASGDVTLNGHEWSPIADLEYACTFPYLNGPTNCTPDKLPDGTDGPAKCDCIGGTGPDSAQASQNPLCQIPAEGPVYGPIQYEDKAYPAVRELQVAKALGDRAVVGSICPSSVDNSQSPATYGYRPVVNAIAERIPR
jgi:hypothetical protein